MTAAAGAQNEAARRAPAWHVAVLVAVAGWLVGVHLAHPGLVDPDEPRSALVARLMVERGDWLAPHLPAVFHHDYPHDPRDGDLLAYWDKPPLYFWLAAAAMKVLGPTALAARLPAAFAHVATVLLVYAAGRRLWGARAGLWAGLVMATAPLPLVMAHVARMDALLVALMTAMLLAALRLVHGTDRPWTWTLVLYGAAGLGLLAKGPAAVALPAAAVLATVALTRRWGDLARLRPVTGAVIALAIAAPWYVYMHMRYPPGADGAPAGFLYEFFVRQHLARATTGEFGHRLLPGTLLAILLGGFLPWTIFLPGACVGLGRDGWRARRERPAVLLLAAWAAVVVLAFSCAKTQLPHYVTPAVPPLALLTGAFVADRLKAGDLGRWLRLGLAVTALLGAMGLAALVIGLKYEGQWHSPYWGLVALVAVLLAAGTVLLARGRLVAPVAILIAGLVATETFIFTADPFCVYRDHTTRLQIKAMERIPPRPDDAVISYPYQAYSFTWYLWGRPVLYPTADGTPWGAPSPDVLVAELNRPRRTFCLLQKRAMVEVLRQQVRWPIRVLSDPTSTYTLIVAEPPDAEAPHEP
jgi:4-amino-4-deoxy-L-arabinose transferase-like glycosyltransferase